ncbi:MAG: hypothetical protein H6832_04135 [Planctomycetes bacterium]|nr:hypothetical protein [Planctomycetota bacterium]
MAEAGRKRRVICPHCGTEFVAGRRACPECGSDERTGWKSAEEISYQSVEIPDTYDPEIWEKGGKSAGRTPRWMIVTAYVVILAFLLSIFGVTLGYLFG